MTNPENFLERWSRRKLEAGEDEPSTQMPSADQAPAAAQSDRETPSTQPKTAQATAPEPGFDLANLPSLDSITAATDIRAFLAPGVPQELARAALRRAWVADPAIRDFVGLSENAWDFTKPGEIPGFGDLPPGTDIKKLVAQVFGEADESAVRAASKLPAIEPEDAQAQPIAGESAAPVLAGSTPDVGAQEPAAVAGAPKPTAVAQLQDGPSNFVQCNNIGALQNSHSENSDGQPKASRSRGRALPK